MCLRSEGRSERIDDDWLRIKNLNRPCTKKDKLIFHLDHVDYIDGLGVSSAYKLCLSVARLLSCNRPIEVTLSAV